ncbi:MAG TPA: S41 family peptidase [Candidatus Paceibacterota bacterium]|jgi:carboxyl-terminal processing protease|nr:S41 family peptidase [Candidatus Paceibacterota bacterium]
MENFSNKKYFSAFVLLIVVSFFAGMYVGDQNRPAIDKVIGISNKETQVTTTADFSPFWKVWNTINEKNPGAMKVPDQDKVYGAIAGLVSSLNDPYSVFFSPDEAKSFEDEIAGNFSGVGMEVGIKDKILTVIAPLKDTPAYRAGIKPGDKILKIDKTSTADLSIDQAIKLMRGEKGTTVVLTIFHDGDKDPTEIKIVRDVINIPTLDTEKRKDGVFVIKLYSFSANSANLFRNAIKQFAESGTDKLLLDLRGNPGGYLDSAVDISSWFLPSGKTVVTEDYGTSKAPEIYRSKGYDIFSDKLKFVILIDSGSASASEIVAGAMQDQKRAKLVGEQSYGKGSVQETIKVTPDTLLKITVAKWLTPNGTSISEKGLTPDYPVAFTKQDADNKKDPQLDKAVEVLTNWPQ